jgi:hypothetical protein
MNLFNVRYLHSMFDEGGVDMINERLKQAQLEDHGVWGFNERGDEELQMP